MMISGPWLSEWNHHVLEILFRLVPNTPARGDWAEFFIENPLIGTWFFAVVFFRYWAIDDEQMAARRECLFRALAALAGASLLTLAIRPWISWPAPLRNPAFQELFPRYLWGGGTTNCFPSHSTLAYFTVAAGFWPLRRNLSVLLAAFALACVSLPRIYLGGHYPIDVLSSCVLSICSMAAVSRWKVPDPISHWLARRDSHTEIRDWLLFLWIFELGEGFRGTEFMIGLLHELHHGR
jgi:membrane-associated phospholipid phosphatase